MKTSIGEKTIIKILNSAGVYYEREKTFKGLKGDTNASLRFDFYIPSRNTVIEFQGQQHYEKVKLFAKTRHDFLKQQEYDRRKASYCLMNHINFYAIPYFELNNLNKYSDLFQDKFLVKTKWHNDIVWRNYKDRI